MTFDFQALEYLKKGKSFFKKQKKKIYFPDYYF